MRSGPAPTMTRSRATGDVGARRRDSQADGAPGFWSRRPPSGLPGRNVCALNGFWRGGPTLYKFPYVLGPTRLPGRPALA